jgi:hypothetical protein
MGRQAERPDGMVNCGNIWTLNEDQQLEKLYKYMDINEISEIHKRTPYAIALRLLKNNIANTMKNVKGHNPKWINPTWDTVLKNTFEQSEQTIYDINKNVLKTVPLIGLYHLPIIGVGQNQVFELCAIIDGLKENIKQLEDKIEYLSLNKID